MELAGCCDLDAERAERFRARFGFARSYTDVRAMIAAEQPAAAAVAVLPDAMCGVAEPILEQGVPLLIEKPPGLTAEEVDRLVAAAERKGRAPVPHQVGFNRRHVPLMREARRRLAGMGPVHHVHYEMTRFDRREPDLVSGGFEGGPGAMTTEVFVPDGVAEKDALARTTHLGVVAHPDDLEILAQPGILDCFGRRDLWFCGVVVTDGAGSPRSGPYADMSDRDMVEIRRHEQRKAAVVGEYGAVVMVGATSGEVKDPRDGRTVRELADLLRRTRPEMVYTHNLADRHDTHVAVALRLIEACRTLPPAERPRRLLGGEVWRDLDWLSGSDRLAVDVTARENIVAALIGVFDSQVTGGKRYDLALLGRRRAHATFDESHRTDAAAGISLFMDMTPLMDPGRDLAGFARERIDRFAADVRERLSRLGA